MSVISRELFSYENLVHALSGAMGSMVGMVAFYPLDTVRCRLQVEEKRRSENTFQTMSELVRDEGVCTLYRGIVPVLESLFASNFVYFYTYNGLKSISKSSSGVSDLLLASVAGVVNVFLTTPLWTVNTRMKIPSGDRYPYESLYDGLKKIAQREGFKTLWRGTIPSLILVSNPALHMAVYQAVKRKFPNAQHTALSIFCFSAFAKMVATVVTYPIQLVQTKQRNGHTYHDLAADAGTFRMLLYIIRKYGFGGLYKGMEAKLLHTILTAALMFMMYEKIAAFVFKALRSKHIKIK